MLRATNLPKDLVLNCIEVINSPSFAGELLDIENNCDSIPWKSRWTVYASWSSAMVLKANGLCPYRLLSSLF